MNKAQLQRALRVAQSELAKRDSYISRDTLYGDYEERIRPERVKTIRRSFGQKHRTGQKA